MADPLVPDTPSLAAKTVDAAETAATFVGNAAKTVVESVANDAKTVVAKDVSLGARAEAGLNLAADAASFVTGPEDAAIERAGVFAVKEAAEHAPQLAEAGVALAKEGIANAPRIAETVGSAFEKTKGLLEKGGHEVLESDVGKGLLETKNAVYHTIEDGAKANYQAIRSTFFDTAEKGKNFAVHAEHLTEESISHVKTQLVSKLAEEKGLKSVLATTESRIEKSIGEMEHGHALRHGLTKAEDLAEKITKPVELGKKLVELGKTAVETAKYVGPLVAGAGVGAATQLHETGAAIEHGAVEALHRTEHVAERVGAHIASAGHGVEDAASHVLQSGEHIADETGKRLATAAKSIADDVKSWSPTMPFEQFEKLMNHARGTPAPAHEPDIARVPVKQQHHGVER